MPHKVTNYKTAIAQRQRLFSRKTALRIIYESFYQKIYENCNKQEKTLEIGSAFFTLFGKSKNLFKDIVLSDVSFNDQSTITCDAHFLPFKNKSFANIIAIDTFHHLQNPLTFLKEASRILKKNGKVVLIEPLVTPISQIIYKFIHHEDCYMDKDPFQTTDFDQHRDPLVDGNNGLPTACFLREKDSFHNKLPEFKITKLQRLSLFVYPLTGGYQNWCLMPASLTKGLLKIENLLMPFLGRLMALRMLLVIEKQE